MFEKQIEAGVQELNRRMPDWIDKINLDILDMNSFLCCILGQTGIEQEQGSIWDDTFHDMNPNYGFISPSVELGTELTSEWRKTIIRLRQQVS